MSRRMYVIAVAWSAAVAVSGSVLAQTNVDEARIHYKAAVLALQDNDLVTADAQLQRALALDPNNALIHYNLAVLAEKRGAIQNGLNSLRRARQLGLPDNERTAAEDLEARLLYKQGRTESRLSPFMGTWSASEEVPLARNWAGDSCGSEYRNRDLVLRDDGSRLVGSYEVRIRTAPNGRCNDSSGELRVESWTLRAQAEASFDGNEVILHQYNWTCSGACRGDRNDNSEAFFGLSAVSETAIARVKIGGDRSVVQFIRKNAGQDAQSARQERRQIETMVQSCMRGFISSCIDDCVINYNHDEDRCERFICAPSRNPSWERRCRARAK